MSTTDALLKCVADLRSVYAEPPAITRGKLAYLDTHCRAWIELSLLVFVATTDADGNCDVGPKSGPPGFVKVLGVSEVLRVNGPATITTDPTTAQRVAIGRSIPRVSIVCEVEEAWLLYRDPGE